MCLRCHSASGGGPNYKRGDIEYTLAEPDREFDVHMSEDGADLPVRRLPRRHRPPRQGTRRRPRVHRQPRRPAHLRQRRLPRREPHTQALLNRHVRRVDCTVCHIPTFARDEPTEMLQGLVHRPLLRGEGQVRPYTSVFETDVVPTYAWFNGTSRIQLPETPVERDRRRAPS